MLDSYAKRLANSNEEVARGIKELVKVMKTVNENIVAVGKILKDDPPTNPDQLALTDLDKNGD